MPRLPIPTILAVSAAALAAPSCHCGHDEEDNTSEVGAFDGLFDGVATGFNFPLDIAIVPDDPATEDEEEGGDIYVASYGTSQIMVARDPADNPGASAEPFFDGTSQGLRGAMAVSIPVGDVIWTAFEQGGTNDAGGLAILHADGTLEAVLDDGVAPGAFARPGGLCWGGTNEDETLLWFFMVNMGDGTAWRIEVSDLLGTDATFVQVGSGLATGTPGNPGSPGNGITSSSDLPLDGARGCVHDGGHLYVADAQNARIVRFEGADAGENLDGVALENTPNELVTYPTDVAVNSEGYLIVISYDNAHAFVALELPGGGFVDNGLHDLNVNAGNYGTAVALDTIWFTRANNQNGTLRAVTPDPDSPPSTAGPFPPQ